MSGNDGEKPEWWHRNERFKTEHDLPPYRPPRFKDDVYTHEVVPELERRYDRSIRFLAVDPTYSDDWEVRADGDRVLTIGRRRDEDGNTVYAMSSEAFVDAVERELSNERS